MRIRKFLVRQYNFGPWLGGFKDLLARTLMYASIIMFINTAVTSYTISYRVFFLQYAPWMSLPVYLLISLLLILLAMVIEFKFIVPSHYTYLNEQEAKHQNVIIKVLGNKIDKLTEEVRALKEEKK